MRRLGLASITFARRLLARAPARRYQSAAEVEAALAGSAVEPPPEEPTSRFGALFGRKRKA